MLDQDRHPDLRRLYTLFLRVPEDVGRQSLRLALRSDIEERGKVINEGESSRAGPSSGAAEQDEEDEDMSGKGKGKGKEKAGAVGGGANALSLALRWVQEVLDLKDKFDRILEEAFVGDKAVQMSINEVSNCPKSNVVLLRSAERTLLTIRHSSHLSMRILEHQNISPCSSMNTSKRVPKRYVAVISLSPTE